MAVNAQADARKNGMAVIGYRLHTILESETKCRGSAPATAT